MDIKRYREVLNLGVLDVMPDGRIFADDIELKPDAKGILKVGKLKGLWVHVLVAVAFIPNPNDFRFVKRIKNDPNDPNYCHKDNLYWVNSPYIKPATSFSVHDIHKVNRIAKLKSKRLSDEHVRLIRESDKPYVILAKKYSCTTQTICNIRTALTYSTVTNADGSPYVYVPKRTHQQGSKVISLANVYAVLASKESDAVLSYRYGIDSQYINSIRHGRALKYVTIPWLKDRGFYVEPTHRIGRPPKVGSEMTIK
jgi:hypothetical protein